jgi:hypothetical protein
MAERYGFANPIMFQYPQLLLLGLARLIVQKLERQAMMQLPTPREVAAITIFSAAREESEA